MMKCENTTTSIAATKEGIITCNVVHNDADHEASVHEHVEAEGLHVFELCWLHPIRDGGVVAERTAHAVEHVECDERAGGEGLGIPRRHHALFVLAVANCVFATPSRFPM